MKKWKLLFPALLLVLAVVCGVYVSDYYPADAVATAALADAQDISVTEESFGLVFAPQAPQAGFIFYPGGKVEHTAYAPLMQALSQKGFLCVLTPMPLKLAVLDSRAAEGIPEAFPEISAWYLGGHSLGGSMAASYIASHSDSYSGLALLAAYSTEDLRASGLTVLSVYGDQDQVLNLEKYAQYRSNLPSDAQEHILPGGNHAQFGAYGPQEGDGTATLAPEAQIRLTANLLAQAFLK